MEYLPCSACRFWEQWGTSSTGTCRRYPPRRGGMGQRFATTGETLFPVTYATDWCGEHTSK